MNKEGTALGIALTSVAHRAVKTPSVNAGRKLLNKVFHLFVLNVNLDKTILY